MSDDLILLFYLTVPAICFVVVLMEFELKIFRMAIVIILTGIVVLFEWMDKRYAEASKEIDETLQIRP
jgi:hypothetical protein